ncbi:MAG TPA: hypothetical protein VG758_14445 [Hyphomicrobiaceae bacterium]|jgi:hypothetical protein|nr:hypothetical protein [Hyphomicrobiaceae bacterium]
MMRVVLIGLAVVIATPDLVGAAESRFSGKYQVSKPRHTTRVNKVDALTVKQKVVPQYNPKEISVDRKVPSTKAPKNSPKFLKSRSPHVMD